MNAGSNLVDGNKTQVWSEMDKREKVRSATSLMVAMETATAAMAEQFDKPTLFVEKNKNIGNCSVVQEITFHAIQFGIFLNPRFSTPICLGMFCLVRDV